MIVVEWRVIKHFLGAILFCEGSAHFLFITAFPFPTLLFFGGVGRNQALAQQLGQLGEIQVRGWVHAFSLDGFSLIFFCFS